jgi:nucleoside-diphosphate-sugar epimerase
LAKGYRIRGTVRSKRKIDQIRQKYPNAANNLELFVVEDMQVDGSFDSLLDGVQPGNELTTIDVDGICHVASPFHFQPKDNVRDLLLPAIEGTTGILKSALNAPSVKRIVVTSTMATISHIGKGVWPGKVYNVQPLPQCADQ